jgi:hypothetical protein
MVCVMIRVLRLWQWNDNDEISCYLMEICDVGYGQTDDGTRRSYESRMK